MGLGGTYHFWGTTGGVVLPVTVNWNDSRYELGLFRVTTQQLLDDHAYREARVMADPYWGMSLSRRWRLIERGPVSGFVGFGLAAKTECDHSARHGSTSLPSSGCASACPATACRVS